MDNKDNGERIQTNILLMKLLAYPNLVGCGTKLWHICQDLNIEITQDFNNFDRAIYWNVKEASVPDKKIMSIPNVINIRCTNVFKDFVDQAWHKASGYTIKINPQTFKYKYVKKSKFQYRSHIGVKHDGEIFEGKKQQIDKHYVYQRYIDTENNYGRHFTIRVPIFKRHIPCLVLKSSKDPFREVRCRITIIPEDQIRNYISKQELLWLWNFCEIMGADFAEIDMVRHIRTGLIYAIDVNNISGDGVYGKLSEENRKMVRKMFAESFKRLL